MSDKPISVNENYDQQYGFHDQEKYVFKAKKGLSKKVVEEISGMKEEPDWMRAFRLKALEAFLKKPLPGWLDPELLSQINFENIYYYLKPTEKQGKTWEEVPEEIKNTFDKLGIPEAERKFLAGVTAQYESEVVYHSIHADLEKQGVVFLGMDDGLKKYPELVKRYFGTVIPPLDNKFASLNSAVWSGGSFIYVPKGVKVAIPLQAYFRINAQNMGQFERTLIIADEGSSVHYIEGCLPAGEQVSTGLRWMNIESIQAGETVLNSDGEEAAVHATRARPYRGDLITIDPLSGGNSFRLTPEHPVLAIRREEVRAPRKSRGRWLGEVNTAKLLAAEPRFVEAGKLCRGDFVVFPIPQTTRDDSRYTIPVLRLLGFYLAEGSTFVHRTLRMPVVVFSFGSGDSDRSHVEETKRLIQEVTGKRAIEVANRKNHGTSVLVYSQPLRDLCLESCGKGAATKELNKTLMDLPPEKQAHLLETYLFGDGSRYQRAHTMVRASTASKTLARQLQELLARQGHYATISLRPGGPDIILGRRITRKDQYILYHSPDRRMGEVRRRGNTFLVPIKGIRRDPYEGPVFNIELNRAPNAYLASGFAVHNCTAPVYASDSLHSAVVELIALPHAHIRYTTIQNWSKNVYNLVTKRAIAHENSIIEWLDGNLGCVRAGELVYTEHGPKPIEEIKPGTRVWSFDEPRQQWVMRPVVAVKDSGLQQVYEVVFSNGRTLHLTNNHPLLAVHHEASRPSKLGRYSLRWTPLQRLSQGDLVAFPTKLATESSDHPFARPPMRDEFTGRNQYGARYQVATHARLQTHLPESADENICWMLGLWIADGDSTVAEGADGGPRYGRVGWSVPRNDRARERLVKLLKRYVGNHRLEERRDGHYFRINSLELALWLRANGLLNGAREKRVPDWVFALPTRMQLAFLAGYLDGDGNAKGVGLSAKSANRNLLSDIQMVVALCGIHASAIYTEETTLDINGTGEAKTYVGHRLDLSHGVRVLKPYVTPGFRARMKEVKLKRNFQRPAGMRAAALLQEDVGVARIVSIRPSITASTYDLEIEGTSSFVVNGILVHNSKLTAKYPAVHLVGRKARGEVVSVAFAGSGQHQDAGAKMVHSAPETSSTILSKSICKDGGRASYRGLVKVYPQAEHVKSSVRCDALLMDERSRSDTYPTMEIDAKQVSIGHEATVSKVGEEQLFYLMSRGLKESEATTMIVNGFFEAFAKELPLEYAVELNRLVQLEMEGSVG